LFKRVQSSAHKTIFGNHWQKGRLIQYRGKRVMGFGKLFNMYVDSRYNNRHKEVRGENSLAPDLLAFLHYVE
jgi:hypothetical protein